MSGENFQFGKGAGILLIGPPGVKKIRINQWGDDSDPVGSDPMDQKSFLKRPRGPSRPILSTRMNEGRRLRIAVNPGSKNSKKLSQWYMEQPSIEATWVIVGTEESVTYQYGGLVQFDASKREGDNPSDDIYILEFATIVLRMGGNG